MDDHAVNSAQGTGESLKQLAGSLLEMPLVQIHSVVESSLSVVELQNLCIAAGAVPDALLEVPDTLCDPRYAGHPLLAASPSLRYCAIALATSGDGLCLGALCVFDDHPRRLTPEQRIQLLRWPIMTDRFRPLMFGKLPIGNWIEQFQRRKAQLTAAEIGQIPTDDGASCSRYRQFD